MTKDGHPIHGRNLDEGRGLEKLAADVEVYKDNKMLFKGTFYIGLVGVYTGMTPFK